MLELALSLAFYYLNKTVSYDPNGKSPAMRPLLMPILFKTGSNLAVVFASNFGGQLLPGPLTVDKIVGLAKFSTISLTQYQLSGRKVFDLIQHLIYYSFCDVSHPKIALSGMAFNFTNDCRV